MASRSAWLILFALLCSACGSSTSPTAPAPPTPTPAPTPTPPPVVANISTSACPSSVAAGIDLGFYRELVCNAFESPAALQPAKRWTVAPAIYLKTVDEAGAPIDAVTLDTMQAVAEGAALQWTGGKLAVTVTRGADSREGVSGWVTVKWPATDVGFCGQSSVAIDGGTVQLTYKHAACGCGGSVMAPFVIRHELGHAFGYWHTDDRGDLMSNVVGGTKACDQQPSGRELAAAAYQYR